MKLFFTSQTLLLSLALMGGSEGRMREEKRDCLGSKEDTVLRNNLQHAVFIIHWKPSPYSITIFILSNL